MEIGEDIDQFQLLEEKIDHLIALVSSLKKEKEAFAEKFQIQEERISDLGSQLESLKASRDKARQRVVGLLEKIEQIQL
jgi:chromosome segregation ATPase